MNQFVEKLFFFEIHQQQQNLSLDLNKVNFDLKTYYELRNTSGKQQRVLQARIIITIVWR